MEGRFRFYTYGKTLELNGVPYEAGRIAEDILNMSRERYLALFDVVTEAQRLSERRAQDKLGEKMSSPEELE